MFIERKHTHGMTLVTQSPWFFSSIFIAWACGIVGPAEDPPAGKSLARKPAARVPGEAGEEKKAPHPIPAAKRPTEVRCPQVPTPLRVKGYEPASFVCPDEPLNGPTPVFVVLHGNYDRPEWQCETWKEAAGHLGFILCPRGVPSDPEHDRWTYAGNEAAGEEMRAAFSALRVRFPEHVRPFGNTYVGFSLGAIYGPDLVVSNPALFDALVLVEGGLKRLNLPVMRRLVKAGIKTLVLAMGVPSRRSSAPKVVTRARRLGLDAHYLDMPGAGHGYSRDFSAQARKILKKSKMSDKEIP